jgi:hypothetical protein
MMNYGKGFLPDESIRRKTVGFKDTDWQPMKGYHNCRECKKAVYFDHFSDDAFPLFYHSI